MNYIKLHEKFIDYFKSTIPRDRLIHRNSSDPRLLHDTLYTEVHHIIPRHANGDNAKDNLVRLLPEEHLFIHQLRYKAFDDRKDMLSVRFCLNGYSSKKYRGEFISKKILAGYAWMRSESARFRKEHGWQTADGRRRISEARKGTMPVVDAITREKKGAVSVNHPKVLSGEWVHHSKGSKASKETRAKQSQANIGSKNGNALKITDDEIIELYIECIRVYEYIISYNDFVRWCIIIKQIKIPKTLLTKTRFEGEGKMGVYAILKERTGVAYNAYGKHRYEKVVLRC